MKTMTLGSLSLVWLVGCGGSLVGGECADGYVPDGEICVPAHGPDASSSSGAPATTSSSSGGRSHHGGAGGDGDGGAGSGDPTSTGTTSSSGAGGGVESGSGAGGGKTTSGAGVTLSGATSGSGGDPTSGSTGTGFQCFPRLAACDGVCEDLADDPANCGGCGVACLGGAACSNGVCGGPTQGNGSGRTIVIGMNFADAKLGDAQAVILGNAIFATAHEPARAIDYGPFVSAGSPSVPAVTDLAVDEAIIRDRTLEAWSMVDAPSVALALASHDFDVLLVLDQDAGSADALAAAGAILAGPMADFVAQGGVVVVLATTAGHGQMGSFLSAGLGLGGSPLAATSALLTNAAPADALGFGVLSTFASSAKTATLPSAPAFATIVADPTGRPVVIATP